MPPESEKLYGFLRGDRFSDFAESLYGEHGDVKTRLCETGDEMFGLLMSASKGDRDAAARASHRLRIQIHTV